MVVDVSSSSSSYDVGQSVEFGSGAVHLVVLKSVLATDVKVSLTSPANQPHVLAVMAEHFLKF